MSNDTQSIAPSEASTLVNDNSGQQQQRTTLTGKPIQHKHDSVSNMMLGDGAGAFGGGSVGANLLPPGYTDKSLVRIPIKMSDVPGWANSSGTEVKQEKKGGLFRKLSGKPKDAKDEVKVVMMSRGDYLKYWAKGEDGKFSDSVVEPLEGRKEWLQKQLELNEEMKRNDPSLGKSNQRTVRGRDGLLGAGRSLVG